MLGWEGGELLGPHICQKMVECSDPPPNSSARDSVHCRHFLHFGSISLISR